MAVLHALPAKPTTVDVQARVEDVIEHWHSAILVAAARPLATLGSASAVRFSRVRSADLTVPSAAVAVLFARELALEAAGHARPPTNGVAILASGALARKADRFIVTMIVGRALLALAWLVRARLAHGRTWIGAVAVAVALPAALAVHALATRASMVIQGINAHARCALVAARAAGGFARQAPTRGLTR